MFTKLKIILCNFNSKPLSFDALGSCLNPAPNNINGKREQNNLFTLYTDSRSFIDYHFVRQWTFWISNWIQWFDGKFVHCSFKADKRARVIFHWKICLSLFIRICHFVMRMILLFDKRTDVFRSLNLPWSDLILESGRN